MSRGRIAGEMALVFAPAIIVLLFAHLWADDPIALQATIWVAYLVMLSTLYLVLRAQGTSFSHLGVRFGFPGWRAAGIILLKAVAVCFLAAAAFALGAVIMGMILGVPEPADMSRYDDLKGNLGLLLLVLAGVYVASSFGEEVLFRGYLMTRVAEVFGNSPGGWKIAVTASTVIFALIHYDWGLAGVVQTGFMGLVLAIAYLKVRRNLWVNIIAHAILDTLLIVPMFLE